MNGKLRLIAILVIAILIPTATAQAYYATVGGELRDSKTNALWTYGANVEVFNCNTLATINTATLTAPTSTFSIDVSGVAVDTPLCIQVTFAAGPNGTPGSAAKGPYPDRLANSGNLNTGVYFTGTGPTAITLRDLSATPHAETGGLWVGLVLALVLLVSGVWILRRRAARV
jgi:hypothetical protein